VPENAGDEDIRKAFRKLAFQHHPDKNIGHEKEAAEKFKDINEAYAVLCEKEKRRQYDMARRNRMAGVNARSPGFGYSSDDIFRDAFNNRSTMDDLNRMFSQAGLRFDQDFLNRVFFSGDNVVIRVYYGSPRQRAYTSAPPVESPSPSQAVENGYGYKPNFVERWAARTTARLGNFVLRKAFGLPAPPPQLNLDRRMDLRITVEEAMEGGEKEFRYKTGLRTKKLMVKIPAGIQEGTQIRLRGMGHKKGEMKGDLFLQVHFSD
jgi:curved DNA-binding protein CbpA